MERVDGRLLNECNVWFDYRDTVPEWAPEWFKAQGATHTIIGQNTGSARGARILKTVVHVLIDEGPDGKGVWETWKVKKQYRI
jgi:hypothetical protein